MKNLMKVNLIAALLSSLTALHGENVAGPERYNVVWDSPSTNEQGSMPIGNGDMAANVWMEQNGDLVLLVAKADAWTELGKLVKLGRVRVQLTPNPFVGATNFTQVLHLENGSIAIKSGANTLQVWADANHPAIHVEATLAHSAALEAKLELWRTTTSDTDGMSELGNHLVQIEFAPDTVFPAKRNQVAWCHFNPSSIYPMVLEQEHLQSLSDKYPDPLLHRCFGAALTGPKLISSGDRTLKSATPERILQLDLIALTEASAASAEAWQHDLDSLIQKTESGNLKQDRDAHQKWWNDFWSRSWIHVSGTADAAKVSQGYFIQRYMMACSSRGVFPVKFNGGLFTVGCDLPPHTPETSTNHTPDYRQWGNCYWNQNNRLLYWPLIATGDYDLLKPWFEMYVQALPLATDRARIYYHHGGAFFPETMLFWGLSKLADFGWNNPTNEIKSRYMRYHIQGALEVIAQMLDYYDHTGDTSFTRTDLIPLADAVVTFYGEHWSRGADGKIRMAPAQSLETYQLDAVNPAPDIAGLKSVLPRMLALPGNLTSPNQRERWAKTLADLPPIPMGKTAQGKLPPDGIGDTNGLPTILPAEQYGPTRNSENPELYVTFPYHLYGVGKPDLNVARTTFAARRFKNKRTCWGQDGTQSAVLGLADEAQKAVVSEFTNYGDQRFPWFWRKANDWIPDLDNGGDGMITIQEMLMQCDGKRIMLLPAWPREWTADFKLHAPLHTTVEGHVQDGIISDLRVLPESRSKDVEIWKERSDESRLDQRAM